MGGVPIVVNIGVSGGIGGGISRGEGSSGSVGGVGGSGGGGGIMGGIITFTVQATPTPLTTFSHGGGIRTAEMPIGFSLHDLVDPVSVRIFPDICTEAITGFSLKGTPDSLLFFNISSISFFPLGAVNFVFTTF